MQPLDVCFDSQFDIQSVNVGEGSRPQSCSAHAEEVPSRILTLWLSHQVVLLQVELQDGVFDGSEDEADVLGVRGAGEVGVDDLVAIRVQVHKHLQDKLPACLGISLGTWGGTDTSAHTHTHTVNPASR